MEEVTLTLDRSTCGFLTSELALVDSESESESSGESEDEVLSVPPQRGARMSESSPSDSSSKVSELELSK